MKSPIFLLSLPRSGSTLLQRVLMSHKEIASIAEPWIMLPFTYALKKEGTLTEYGHATASAALENFVDNLPLRKQDYFNCLGEFTEKLYEKQCTNNEKYFLDKTPRYYNIISEIAEIFPNAKFIFLFRNPVHVISSMIQTWGNGSLRGLYNRDRDLKYGPIALSEGYKQLKDKSYAINYEKYVTEPVNYTKKICEYLEIDFDENMLSSFSTQELKGNMGDSTGVKEYKIIDTRSLEKWKNTFDTKYRQRILKKYIQTLDDELLKIQGYDKQQIIHEISKLETEKGSCIKDRTDMLYSHLIRFFKPNIWFGKSDNPWSKNRYLS